MDGLASRSVLHRGVGIWRAGFVLPLLRTVCNLSSLQPQDGMVLTRRSEARMAPDLRIGE